MEDWRPLAKPSLYHSVADCLMCGRGMTRCCGQALRGYVRQKFVSGCRPSGSLTLDRTQARTKQERIWSSVPCVTTFQAAKTSVSFCLLALREQAGQGSKALSSSW